ncbi:hypothetical protein Y1Q_0012560 [Alligator mississippiensis]|uniref:Uncharacterized protein n=1 Tax=Alligator mississippiensis TaxID=8496 RepID=A0A151M832_ALLMI|nr:hypothetical protein Y1Q_0012560 [Alligator mississippiensis]
MVWTTKSANGSLKKWLWGKEGRRKQQLQKCCLEPRFTLASAASPKVCQAYGLGARSGPQSWAIQPAEFALAMMENLPEVTAKCLGQRDCAEVPEATWEQAQCHDLFLWQQLSTHDTGLLTLLRL